MPTNAAGAWVNASPLRVLLVDDHPVSRGACRALLRTQGAEVIDAFAFLAKADICHETVVDAVRSDESRT